MRLQELPTVGSASIEWVCRALAGYEVMSAVPVMSDPLRGDTVLAATPQGLAIVADRRPKGEPDHHHTVIRWANWSAVHLAFDTEPQRGDDDTGFLIVRVGRKAFAALAEGPVARQALREFRLTVQRLLRSDRDYVDYDAASTLTR
jgi:hypothetical protein